MKPAFALSLSFEGISLLHRAAGGWRTVGDVDLTDPNLGGALSDLRARAMRLETNTQCKLIIPNDQIRYISIETGSFEGDAQTGIVTQALEQATPYALTDLVYDVAPDGTTTHVAAVARETLAEAAAFAIEHGFEPVSFVSVPGPNAFLGEPYFGTTALAASWTGAQAVEPDGIAVVVIGQVQMPEPAGTDPKVSRNGPQDNSALSDPSVIEPQTAQTATVGFTSRRSRAPDTEPADTVSETEVRAEIPPDALEAEAQPEPDPDPITLEEKSEATTPIAAPVPDIAVDTRPVSEPESTAELPVARPIEPPQDDVTQLEVRSPTPDADKDEADRLTVFGARRSHVVGGKPRNLGLILTVLLLMALAAVAAWASLFLERGIAGLFRFGDEKPAIIAAPVPKPDPDPSADPVADAAVRTALPTPPEPLEENDGIDPTIIAALPAPRMLDRPDSTEPVLSEEDAAVLDALSESPDVDAPETAAQTTPSEETARYAATGIWPTAPAPPDLPALIGLDDIYFAAIDANDLSQDAVALPAPGQINTDSAPAPSTMPASRGQEFDLNDRGLVKATPEGARSPDGILVYLGKPPVVPPPSPLRFQDEPTVEVEQEYLAGFRPRSRPANLVELNERAKLGGRSREELAGLRPKIRPESLQQKLAAQTAAIDSAIQSAAVDSAVQSAAQASVAVVSGPRPKLRPEGLASRARRTQQSNLGSLASLDQNTEPEVGTFVPRAVAPKIPSSASVSRQATIRNSINLRRLNLIGVYGTQANRRALVRLPSGRYKKVKVGDRLDGGRIVAIGDSELRYQKSGRNVTLKIPSS